MIGMGRQAVGSNLKFFLNASDTQVVAVCDVDAWRLDNAQKTVEKHYAQEQASGTFKGCSIYKDFRELLDRTDIDTVMISTPDHWHVPMAIAAARAGKDICCEKPLTLSIAEGRALSDIVQRYNRVFRTDSEFRSHACFQRACELVLNGRIGRVRTRVSSGHVSWCSTGESAGCTQSARECRLVTRPVGRNNKCRCRRSWTTSYGRDRPRRRHTPRHACIRETVMSVPAGCASWITVREWLLIGGRT